ncbi:MAG: PilZ domain-containing protein [Betaproteobacteria bacterium]|nr:MAG: PilZ domain-containing protein [Betaproteobacteria bacterium]
MQRFRPCRRAGGGACEGQGGAHARARGARHPGARQDGAAPGRQLDGKVVRADASRGVIRDIGYNGALAELERPLPRHAELKLAFELPALGYHAGEVYARVVASREQDGRALAGLEFTSLADETSAKIRLFVQMLLQGEYRQVD